MTPRHALRVFWVAWTLMLPDLMPARAQSAQAPLAQAPSAQIESAEPEGRQTGHAATTASAPSVASEASTIQWWLNAGILSHHFNRDLGLRERNPGGGVEVVIAEDHAFLAGTYLNSDDANTHYLGWFWRPLQYGPVRAGLIAGAFDGYPRMHGGGWFAAALPAASVEYGRLGANLTILPTIPGRLYGAVAIQFKLRVW